jgi:hypothetical protein
MSRRGGRRSMGRYVADAIERRREISGLLRAMKALI